MISKLETALQELDETVYWLELLITSGIVSPRRLEALMSEANEIISIIVAFVKTIKNRRR